MSDFKAKCTKFDFGWGSATDPAGGAYSAYSKGLLLRGWKGKGRKGGKGNASPL